jgi:serine/threonine protein kinase
MVLGVGGFGVTYLALDYLRNQICAVKEYFPGDLAARDEDGCISPKNKESEGAFQDGMLIFRQETEMLRLFAGERGIVDFSRAFQENNTLYYVMEYLDGASLYGLAKSMGETVPLNFAAHIITRAGWALDKVHQKGILHLDVSPENIFILKSGSVKLIDFGAARYYTDCGNKGVTVHLKPDFAPPEQYSSHAERGPWTDVYALGATFYYVTTGRKIPAAPIRQKQSGEVPASLGALAPDADPRLSAGVEKATRLNPAERYQSVPEFIRDAGLEQLAAEGKISGGSLSGIGGVSEIWAEIREQGRQIIGGVGGRWAELKNEIKNQRRQIVDGIHPPEPPRRAQPYLLCTNGSMRGVKWQIVDNAEIALGRSAQHSNIVISDLNISRVHCLIRYDWGTSRFFIRDQSSNGTFGSDGRRFAKGVVQPLSPGEEFYLYARTFTIKVGLE